MKNKIFFSWKKLITLFFVRIIHVFLPPDCSLGYLLQNIIWQVYSSMSGSISKKFKFLDHFQFFFKKWLTESELRRLIFQTISIKSIMHYTFPEGKTEQNRNFCRSPLSSKMSLGSTSYLGFTVPKGLKIS